MKLQPKLLLVYNVQKFKKKKMAISNLCNSDKPQGKHHQNSFETFYCIVMKCMYA